MPVIDDDVPQWKKELIQKKQMWKKSGGWSVPPLTSPKLTSSSGLKIRLPEFNTSLNLDQMVISSPVTPNPVIDTNNNGFSGSVENFVTVDELKSTFSDESDEVFKPLSKARSAENILDAPVSNEQRRASTSNPLTGYYRKTTFTNGNGVPKMEDFFRKYRVNTRKSVVESEVDSPRVTIEKPRRKRIETVYFADMNQNELPPPNTVKQTVKVFEDPVNIGTKSDQTSMETPPEALPRARDVVRKFEAKIRSNAPPKPPRTKFDERNGASSTELGQNPTQKPRKPALISPTSRKDPSKHVSFDANVTNGDALNFEVDEDVTNSTTTLTSHHH